MQRLESSLTMVRAFTFVALLSFAGNCAWAQEEMMVKAFGLRQTSAEEVAKTLGLLVPDAAVNVDSRSNLIIVAGTEEVLKQIEDWIKELDGLSKPQRIQVFPLSNCPAGEAAELLTQVVKDNPRVGSVSIVPDERANSLLVRATEEDFDVIEQLLEVIDTEPAATMDVKVFQLRNADAAAVSELIHDMFSNAAISGVDGTVQLRVAVDERTNSVIVTGPRDALSVVEALLMRLDEGREPSPADLEPLQIQVLWVVSGDDWTDDDQPQLAALPDDLADVAGELDSLGIGNPRIATQMVVNSSGRFSVSGSARLGNQIQVAVNGTISVEAGRPTLNISIQAVDGAPGGGFGPSRASRLCELETTLKTPLGHFVVLGVSPIDGRNSAFVVQVSGIEQ